MIFSLAGPDADGMVLLSAGTFTMGDIQGEGGTDESPTHSVTLSSFYISEDEVTASEYAACVSAGSCTAQSSGAYSTLGDTTGKAVHYVSWDNMYRPILPGRIARLHEPSECVRKRNGNMLPVQGRIQNMHVEIQSLV